jgi:glycosyltransferase involved in cell wall biosynthesis
MARDVNMTQVSVIIPSYNAAASVGGTLDSVLAQTMPDFEILVVDDGSKDETASVVRPYLSDPRVRYLPQANRGLPGARNAGAQASVGRYLAFLDADDFFAPTALETMVQEFQQSGAAWSITGVLKLDGEKRTVRPVQIPEGDLLLAILRDDFVTRSPFYLRKEFFDSGMYDEEIRVREDWDLNIRMIASGKRFVVIDQPLYHYSRSEGSITTGNRRKLYLYTEKLLKKHHKRLADSGNRQIGSIYAENMWHLARQYCYEIGDYRSALRCAGESLGYDFRLTRLIHPLIHRVHFVKKAFGGLAAGAER